MRTLNLNKSMLWMVKPLGKTPILDADGFKTGEYTISYSIPKAIHLPLYPSGGSIAEKIFGKDTSFDMISCSNDLILDENCLLFLNEPLNNFGTTYDYSISAIKKSVNTYNYGLRKRV